jgi:transcriptional regulator with XRE-family HTH domain
MQESAERKRARKALGVRLKDARERCGLTQGQVGKALGIPRNCVTRIETGDRGLDALELVVLSQLFKRSPLQLLDVHVRPQERLPDTDRLLDVTDGLGRADMDSVLTYAQFLRSRPSVDADEDPAR